MAKTSKGIYYPYDYNKIADVPEDMKQMAESINKVIEEDESNINNNIERITALEQQKNNLSKQMPHNTTKGESLHLEDSAEWDENSLIISGNLRQEKRSGKNLFKLPKTATSNGVTLTNNGDGSFTLNGTTTGIAIFSATLNNPLKIGTYTLSYKSSIALGNDFFLRARDKDNTLVHSANPVSQVMGNNSTYNSATYTSNIETAIVAINLTKTGVTYNNVVIYPQLEEGSVATDFEQYGAMPSTEFPSMPKVATGVQKIRQFGKNWFKNTAKSQTINGVTFTVNADGTVLANGTSTATAVLNVSKEKLLLETGDYMLSGCPVGGDTNKYKLDFISKNTETNITRYPVDLGQTKYVQVKEPEIISAVRIVVYAGITLNNVVFKPMLEKGSKATPYEPYAEEVNNLNLGSTELCKITDENGNVVAQDRAVFRNGKWQWEKNIIKIALSSTANWQLQTTWSAIGDKTNAFFIAKHNEVASEKEVACSHFNFVKNIYSYDVEGIFISSSIIIRLPKSVAPDVATLKTYLANNTVYAYCVRTTPVYEDCTAAQSEVLDKLYNNFELSKGTNNVIVESSNGVGVDMELTYMQDNILKDKKLEDRVIALENLLSTTQTSALLLDNLQNDLESEVN